MIILEKEQKYNDLIDNILYTSGVDVDFHLKPHVGVVEELSDIDKKLLSKGVELLNKHLITDSRIGLVVDADLDGVTSSALLYQYLVNDIGINKDKIHVIQHRDKAHGLTKDVMRETKEIQPSLIILPDSSSNDYKQHKELNELGIDVLIIDHHEYEEPKQLERTLVINNQVMDLNKHLTGVGMVYKFIQYYTKYNEYDINTDKYLDLVMLGSTGDVADIADKELRYYVHQGTNNPQNKFLLETLKEKKMNEFSTRDMSFSLISMVNSVCRIGTKEEREILFQAFVDSVEEGLEITVRKKNKKTGKMESNLLKVDIQGYAYDMARKIKTRQDRLVKKAMESVITLYDGKIYVGLLGKEHPSSINGLVAMKLVSQSGKPTMICKRKNGFLSGSARADFDFKRSLNEIGLFEYAQGHGAAFGWGIKQENFDQLIKDLDDGAYRYLLDDIKHEHTVDRLYTSLNTSVYLDLIKIEENKSIFGGSVTYPLLGFSEISFHKSCIKPRGSMITLFDKDIPFVIFGARTGLYESLVSNLGTDDRVTVSIVGEPSLDWNGEPQVVVKDIQIIEPEKEEFNAFGIDF